MTPKNFFTYLESLLKGLVWTGTSNKIFGNSVYFVVGNSTNHLSRFHNATCLLMDLGGNIHPEHPNLVYQQWSLAVFVENVNDTWGEGVLLSANRTINTSQGAGLIDIESEVIGQLIKTITLSGSKVSIVEKQKVKQSVLTGNAPSCYRIWQFETLLSLF